VSPQEHLSVSRDLNQEIKAQEIKSVPQLLERGQAVGPDRSRVVHDVTIGADTLTGAIVRLPQ
jgi:hypothetical protein